MGLFNRKGRFWKALLSGLISAVERAMLLPHPAIGLGKNALAQSLALTLNDAAFAVPC